MYLLHNLAMCFYVLIIRRMRRVTNDSTSALFLCTAPYVMDKPYIIRGLIPMTSVDGVLELVIRASCLEIRLTEYTSSYNADSAEVVHSLRSSMYQSRQKRRSSAIEKKKKK
jgi:hypothetical protein